MTLVAGGNRYALPADDVMEVLRRPTATRVPHGPTALVGVFNLRGSVLPMVSLAALLGVPAGAEQNVVILDHNGLVGVLIDTVPLITATGDKSQLGELDLQALLDAGMKRQNQVFAASILHDQVQEKPTQIVRQRVLVSFVISGQSFALPLASVIEVHRLPDEISRVAHEEKVVMGVINMRNQILPVISLSKLLGFPEVTSIRSGQPVMVVEHNGSKIGLVPDTITSILRLGEEAIDPVPAVLQRGLGETELDAIGRTGAKSLVSILSVPKLFADPMLKEVVIADVQVEGQSMAVDQGSVDEKQKYLIFDLGEERYGLPVSAVAEVLRLPEDVTRLPNGPKFVSGIINLRGSPIPLIDQRQRFGVTTSAPVVRPRVIIVAVGELQAGFVVDRASQIIALASSEIAEVPQLSSEPSTVFKHIANIDGPDGNLILIVDPKELLSRAEQDAIAELTSMQVRAVPQ